ncbi:glycosyltransferase 87 family protein [Streptomyces roseoverticillatus]|uniref:glycosyltransferase 87 family protein n=1 Tax=Streptomyces roseoverticillatus TaxID=66429 RepID=UPI0033F3ECB5
MIVLPRRPAVMTAVTTAALAALTAVLVRAVRSDAYVTDPAALAGWYAVAWALFGAAAWALRHAPARHVTPLVLAGSVAVAACGLVAEPRTSSDVYRYVWDGRVQAAGISPYDRVPGDPALSRLRDDWLFPRGAECERPERFGVAAAKGGPSADPSGTAVATCTLINRPSVHTVYPPVAEGYFLLVHALSPADARHKPFQVGGAVLSVAVSALLLAVLRRRGRARWAAYWAWCPAVAVEAVNNAHADVLGVLFAVAGLAAVRAHRIRGGTLIGAGIATKLLPAVVLPGALAGAAAPRPRRPDGAVGSEGPVRPLRRSLAVLLPAAAVVGLGYLPYLLVSHGSVLGYLGGYAEEEGYDDPTVKNRYALLRLVLPASWSQPAVLVLCAAVVAYVLRRGDPEQPCRSALLVTGAAFLLTTPGYSWYALLLIALVALDGRWEWLGVAMAGAAKYVGGRAVDDSGLLGTVAYALAGTAVLAGWLVRRQRDGRALKRTGPEPESEPGPEPGPVPYGIRSGAPEVRAGRGPRPRPGPGSPRC